MKQAAATSILLMGLVACGGGGSDAPDAEPAAPTPGAPTSFRGLSSYEVQYWGNADAVATLGFEDGSTISLEGERGADDVPTALTRMHYRAKADASASEFIEGTVELGANGTPSLLLSPDGSRLKMEWDAARNALNFVYINADGSKQAVSTVDLKTLKPTSAAQATGSPRSWRRLADVALPSPERSAALAAAKPLAAATTKTVSVDVKRCGRPVDDAKVEISFRPNNPNQLLPSKTYAKHVANGTYVASFGVSTALDGAAGKACRAVSGILGTGCEFTKSFKDQEVQVCAALAAAIDTAIFPPSGEGLVIAPKCVAMLKSYNAYCIAHDGPVEGADGLSAADFVCNAIAKLEDALPSPAETPYTWSAKAFVEGRTAGSGTQIVPYKDNVALAVDFGGTPNITSLTTLPFDPLPLSDYVVSAGSACTVGWSSTLQVIGTDGYTDSFSKPNALDPEFLNLSVPGAEAGVSDKLILTVQPPAGSSAAPLRREIGVTF